jgi:hypothetical protein
MYKLLCSIKSLSIASLLIVCIGCFGVYSFENVATMSDSRLKSEYLDIERELGEKHTLYFGERTYGPPAGLEEVSLERDIKKFEDRLNELNLEMSNRGIMP